MILDTRKLRRLWSYLRPYWRYEALMFVIMVVLTGLSLALPGAIQYMIDSLIPGLVASAGEAVDYTPVFLFGSFLFGIYLLDVLFAWLRDYLGAYIGVAIIRDIRLELFGHVQRLSLQFHSRHQTGEIMSRLLSDVGRLQDLLTVTLLMFLTNLLMLVGIMAYLLHTNWFLTLVAVVPVPLTIYATHRFGLRLNRLVTTMQQTIAELSARLQEAMLGVKTIKAFGRERHEESRVEAIQNRINPLIVNVSKTTSLGVNLVQFINMVGPIVVLAWGVYLVATGGMKLGELIAFYILLTYLYAPVRGLAETHIQVQSAMASADRVFEYLDIPADIVESPTPVHLEKPRGEIRFDSVAFSYGDQGFGLDGLSLVVRPREKIALVGPSGSGKTTIINLLMRFFDPQHGSVCLDGIDVRNLSFVSLRRHIALVEQDPFLFRMSIYDNIAYGFPEAIEADVIAAAKAANIHEFIMELPQGYRTEVGERGVTVSGGERQRLCLARAILKNPTVLILDEATSALDSNSEQLIQESLSHVLADKTAIIIAHRLATIQHVDRIIALDDGRIVDQGTHDELTGRCLLYRELARKQMLL
ncbi:MAG: ABC transporter ATP-binding protein [Candidatus Zixiibacteriota bacterium]